MSLQCSDTVGDRNGIRPATNLAPAILKVSDLRDLPGLDLTWSDLWKNKPV